MKVYLLPREEWHRLQECNIVPGLIPSPELACCAVAEDGGKIVGFWFGQLELTLEPIWIREDKRNGTVGMRMFKVLEDKLKSLGAKRMVVHPLPKHEDYAKRLGFNSNGTQVFQRMI